MCLFEVVSCRHRNNRIQGYTFASYSHAFYQPIQVFRYDKKLKTLYIQAGVTDEIALIIKEDGNWNFVL